MTRKLYQDDSYLFEFESTVTAVNKSKSGYQVILESTVFYPESGGQLADTGLLDGNQVTDVRINDSDEIIHLCSDWKSDIGCSVTGKIDSNWRLDNMRKHTGQHILSGAFLKVAEAETVSAHLGEVESTIELSSGSLADDILRNVEDLANDIVMQDIPVNISYHDRKDLDKMSIRKIPDREGIFRIVKIGEFDHTACGGTHCRRSGEVGMIKIVAYEKIRNHLRIIFLTGKQAVDDYRKKNDVISKLMMKCTCHFSGLEKSFQTLTDRNSEFKKEVGRLQKELMPHEIEMLKKKAKQIGDITLISERFTGSDIKYLRELALNLNKQFKTAAVLGLDDILLIASSEDTGLDSSQIAKIFIKKCGGRGGGNQVLAQIGGISLNDRKKFFEFLVQLIEYEVKK